MTRKLSLTTAVAVAALSLGVPAALGVDRQPDSSQLALDSVAYFQANERKTLAAYLKANERKTLADSQGPPRVSPDTQELIEAAGQPTQSNLLTRSDSAESAIVAGRPITRSDSAESAIVAGRQDAPVVSTGSSGNEIEWPQVGIGLGIGILLGLGLLLALRSGRIRPLAH